jgi:hypothetical protein
MDYTTHHIDIGMGFVIPVIGLTAKAMGNIALRIEVRAG